LEWLSECPVCESTKIIRWGKKYFTKREKPRDLGDAEDQFLLERLKRKSLVRNLYLCLQCSFLFQNPTYDAHELQQIYGDLGARTVDYYESVGKPAEDLWDSSLARKNLDKRRTVYAEAILSFGASKILDYGGRSGINLQHPSLNQTERYVYDFGKDSFPAKGIVSLKTLDTDQNFDFILHTHVLEHEPDPKTSLVKLRHLIEPAGSLYLEVPFDYAERIITRRPGAIWHVNHFNRKTIVEVGRTAGWRCRDIRIMNLPYSHSTLNCVVAIMKPDFDGSHPNRSPKTMTVGFDMMWALFKRATHPSVRSRLFRAHS
jgi:hypothetical protein